MRRAPAAVGHEVVVRDLATFVLTFDHRALDGAPAARFLARLRPLAGGTGDLAGLTSKKGRD